ncbi:hypothetical protein Tco_1553406 [Tanacetum coccineum]
MGLNSKNRGQNRKEYAYGNPLKVHVVLNVVDKCMPEGHNAGRLEKLYAGREDVLAPDIFWDYTELTQLLEYGYFDANPHPVNLLSTPDGKLAFLNFEMMSETPEQARFAIINHVVHMVNWDYEAMACDYYALDYDVNLFPIIPACEQGMLDEAQKALEEAEALKKVGDGPRDKMNEFENNVAGSEIGRSASFKDNRRAHYDEFHQVRDMYARLVPSCCVIFDLEPLSLSFDFVFTSEIFKSLSFSIDRLCHLAILCLDQHVHTLHHLESLLTISLDRLDILKEDLVYQSLRKSLSLILELS